jgi:adenylate cyclase
LTGERLEWRLVAVLTADVAGCSRLIGEDEEGTLPLLNSERRITE